MFMQYGHPVVRSLASGAGFYCGKKDNMGRFDTVLWDVDQTLLDFSRSESYAVKYCFEQFGLTAADETVRLYSEINISFWKRIEKGEIDKKEALVERFRMLFERTGIKNIDAGEFQKLYSEALGSVYYFQDNSYELIMKLKGRYRQYLVTNGVTRTQRKKLELSGLDKLVEDIFVSEEIGAPKPQKEFFEKCFEKIPDFCRDRAIIVGDSLSSDMLGGRNAGIKTCWYNPAGLENTSEVDTDYEIRNLNDIISILEKE